MSSTADVRHLRSEMRRWRRSRADTSLLEVAQEAYVVVLSVVVLGSMTGSVLVNLSARADLACVTSTCLAARAALPWLGVVAALAVVLALGRLLGPILATPPAAAWLLSTPLDRTGLLRRQLAVGATVAMLGAALVAGVTGSLAGYDGGSLAVFTAGAGGLAAAGHGWAALRQGRGGVGPVAVGLAALGWCCLLLLAGGQRLGLPVLVVPMPGLWAFGLLGLLMAATVLLAAARRLRGLHRSDLVAGGRLGPALSGALAVLDLALLHDVLLDHRWRRRSTTGSVRSVRTRARGRWAVVARDAVRVRRSPGTVAVLAGTLVVPYLMVALGLGRATVVLTGAAGFLGALALGTTLRLLTRTRDWARMLPWRDPWSYAVGLVVPGVVLLLWGWAAAPALATVLDLGWPTALLVASAVAAAALAGMVRWVTARPPDYGRPLVSSPAGAVPPTLPGAVLRGFDVVLLVSLPTLVWPDAMGALGALVIAGVTLAALATRS